MRVFTDEMAQALNECGKYLMVHVLRPVDFPDCTMNGVTSRFARLYVPHPEGYLTLEQCEPEQVLEVIPPAFANCPPRLQPRGEKRWCMAGGNYVESSDSRFARVYGAPISVHDRIEF